MTPHTDPCCHGAGVAASTRPRTATPLINHLGHRVVTGLCRLPVHGEAGPHLRGQRCRPGSGPPAARLSWPARPASGKASRSCWGEKGGWERAATRPKAVSGYTECRVGAGPGRELGGWQPDQGPLSGVGLLEGLVEAQGFALRRLPGKEPQARRPSSSWVPFPSRRWFPPPPRFRLPFLRLPARRAGPVPSAQEPSLCTSSKT